MRLNICPTVKYTGPKTARLKKKMWYNGHIREGHSDDTGKPGSVICRIQITGCPLPRLLIRKHEKVSKINVFKGREHGTKSKNLILTGTKGADVKISALFLSPRHRQPPYGVFSYPCLYPPEKCIN